MGCTALGRLLVSSSRDYFVVDGEKFFYLADTAWSAFTNASLEDWAYYLEIRRSQGFNAVQLNILPQHDRSVPDLGVEPFETAPSGGWDFAKISGAYFDRAEKMVEMAVERGLVPALVVLWYNYVRGTRAADPSKIIPFEHLQSYVEYVVERFAKYDPIFIISGDTDFKTDEALKYYLAALEIVKKRAPHCLTTMHLISGLVLPEPFVYSPHLDFYMYQSGHKGDQQHLAYELAQKFYSLPVKRPIVNGEPCYENICGMGHRGGLRRFTRSDVRKAIWQSLLSGAKAGVAYGALGIWNWHTLGKRFTHEKRWGPSYDWKTALAFPGACDAAFARWVFERYDLFDIEPANDRLAREEGVDPREYDEIRVSIGRGKVVLYMPYPNYAVKLAVDGSAYRWEGIELDSRRVFRPRIDTERELTSVRIPEFVNTDSIVIGTER